jgi:DNA adenine methylase
MPVDATAAFVGDNGVAATASKATAHLADEPRHRPFVKWAGGKRQLLRAIRAHVPAKYGRYFEPFVGGGALFFALRPKRATLTDVNERLIRAYRGVRNDVETTIGLLRWYEKNHAPEFFYRMRELGVDALSDAEVAAWFVYLNKSGFNGLYRVNSKNRFNVPLGRYDKPAICDEETLRDCSEALASVEEPRVASFDDAVKGATRGDFVYFDPPYVPLSATSSFTSYTADGFSDADQAKLRDLAASLKARGVRVLLSNSCAERVKSLYAKGFELIEVHATRSVNSKGAGRGAIKELLIK